MTVEVVMASRVEDVESVDDVESVEDVDRHEHALDTFDGPHDFGI